MKQDFSMTGMPPSGPLGGSFTSWDSIFTKYMSLNLTYESDRVVAFASAASVVNSRLDYAYIAGFWNVDLEHQLMWIVKHPESTLRPKAWRAPTWSWLSIEGPVEASKGTFGKAVGRIVDLVIDLVDPEQPTGEMTGGSMKREAFFRGMTFGGQGPSTAEKQSFNLPGTERSPGEMTRLFWDTDPANEVQEWYILPLLLNTSHLNMPYLDGLVITPVFGRGVDDSSWLVFRRVGAFNSWSLDVCAILNHEACGGLGCEFEPLSLQEMFPQRDEANLTRLVGSPGFPQIELVEEMRVVTDRIEAERHASYEEGLRLENIILV